MAVVRVYEGDFAQADIQEFLTEALKGGAVGGSAQLLSEMVVRKFLPNLSPLVRVLVASALPIGVAIYLKEDNPSLAIGVATGAAAVATYRLANMVLANQASNAPMAGIVDVPALPAVDLGAIELHEVRREGEPDVTLEVV